MISVATKENTKELFNLESSVFSKDDFGLSVGSFYYHIKRNHLFVYKQDNKIVGYILWLKRKNNYRLYSLCIKKEFQGQGIATKLLEYSFKILETKSFTLEVKTINKSAIKLYEKNNFKIKKVLKNYYPNNIDGYLMYRSSNGI
ncbi:MAG: GNAT family N-acetyltransferase [Arcobacteraceae bacterium]|nr:GNAT family N-acetyltransferase [Arcobacteraceae bacterium]